MKNFIVGFIGLVILATIIDIFDGESKVTSPSSSGSQLNSDPACVDLRARLAAPDAVNTITVEDLALSQRCGTN